MAWWEDSGWPDWLKVPVQAGPVEAVEHCTGWAAFVLQLVTRGSPGPRFAPWMQPSWGAIAHLECLQRQQPRGWQGEPGALLPLLLQSSASEGRGGNSSW